MTNTVNAEERFVHIFIILEKIIVLILKTITSNMDPIFTESTFDSLVISGYWLRTDTAGVCNHT